MNIDHMKMVAILLIGVIATVGVVVVAAIEVHRQRLDKPSLLSKSDDQADDKDVEAEDSQQNRRPDLRVVG